MDRLPWKEVGLYPRMPLPALEVDFVDPALVDVDDPVSLLEQLKQLLRTLLADYKTPLGVPLEWDPLDLAESHIEVGLQDVANEPGL